MVLNGDELVFWLLLLLWSIDRSKMRDQHIESDRLFLVQNLCSRLQQMLIFNATFLLKILNL